MKKPASKMSPAERISEIRDLREKVAYWRGEWIRERERVLALEDALEAARKAVTK